MAVASTLSDADLLEPVSSVFRSAFPNGGQFGLDVAAGTSFDEDPMVFVTAVLPSDIPLPRGSHLGDLQVRLANSLIDKGDLRSTYLRLLHPSDIEELQRIEPDDPVDA